MAFKAEEICEITVGGMRYRDWETVTVKLEWEKSNNSFRFTVSEGKPLAKNWADIRIRPGDKCTITLAGELAITGYVETRTVAYVGTQHGIELIGVGETKALADGAAMTQTQEFRKKPWQQIAEDVIKPFGIKLAPKTGLNAKPFERASIAPGETAWQFLEGLARQRGIILGSDKQGNLTAAMAYTGGGDMLIEGINILEGREVMTIKGGMGVDYSDTQHGGSNDQWGPKVAHDPTSNSKNQVDPGGKGVYAPNKQVAEHPGLKADTESRSKMESRTRGNEQLQVTIVVQGWLKPSGGLWEPGKKVHVKSPMLIVDEPLNLMTATFTQNDKTGTRTTLELSNGELGTGVSYSDTGQSASPPAADSGGGASAATGGFPTGGVTPF